MPFRSFMAWNYENHGGGPSSRFPAPFGKDARGKQCKCLMVMHLWNYQKTLFNSANGPERSLRRVRASQDFRNPV